MQHVSWAVSYVYDLVIAKVITQCFVFSRPSSFLHNVLHNCFCKQNHESDCFLSSNCFSTSVCPACCISLRLISY